MESGDFSFIMGQRGCTLLAYKGYNFVKNRKSGVKTYWICAKKVSVFVLSSYQIYIESFKYLYIQK